MCLDYSVVQQAHWDASARVPPKTSIQKGVPRFPPAADFFTQDMLLSPNNHVLSQTVTSFTWQTRTQFFPFFTMPLTEAAAASPQMNLLLLLLFPLMCLLQLLFNCAAEQSNSEKELIRGRQREGDYLLGTRKGIFLKGSANKWRRIPLREEHCRSRRGRGAEKDQEHCQRLPSAVVWWTSHPSRSNITLLDA